MKQSTQITNVMKYFLASLFKCKFVIALVQSRRSIEGVIFLNVCTLHEGFYLSVALTNMFGGYIPICYMQLYTCQFN